MEIRRRNLRFLSLQRSNMYQIFTAILIALIILESSCSWKQFWTTYPKAHELEQTFWKKQVRLIILTIEMSIQNINRYNWPDDIVKNYLLQIYPYYLLVKPEFQQKITAEKKEANKNSMKRGLTKLQLYFAKLFSTYSIKDVSQLKGDTQTIIFPLPFGRKLESSAVKWISDLKAQHKTYLQQFIDKKYYDQRESDTVSQFIISMQFLELVLQGIPFVSGQRENKNKMMAENKHCIEYARNWFSMYKTRKQAQEDINNLSESITTDEEFDLPQDVEIYYVSKWYNFQSKYKQEFYDLSKQEESLRDSFFQFFWRGLEIGRILFTEVALKVKYWERLSIMYEGFKISFKSLYCSLEQKKKLRVKEKIQIKQLQNIGQIIQETLKSFTEEQTNPDIIIDFMLPSFQYHADWQQNKYERVQLMVDYYYSALKSAAISQQQTKESFQKKVDQILKGLKILITVLQTSFVKSKKLKEQQILSRQLTHRAIPFDQIILFKIKHLASVCHQIKHKPIQRRTHKWKDLKTAKFLPEGQSMQILDDSQEILRDKPKILKRQTATDLDQCFDMSGPSSLQVYDLPGTSVPSVPLEPSEPSEPSGSISSSLSFDWSWKKTPYQPLKSKKLSISSLQRKSIPGFGPYSVQVLPPKPKPEESLSIESQHDMQEDMFLPQEPPKQSDQMSSSQAGASKDLTSQPQKHHKTQFQMKLPQYKFTLSSSDDSSKHSFQDLSTVPVKKPSFRPKHDPPPSFSPTPQYHTTNDWGIPSRSTPSTGYYTTMSYYHDKIEQPTPPMPKDEEQQLSTEYQHRGTIAPYDPYRSRYSSTHSNLYPASNFRIWGSSASRNTYSPEREHSHGYMAGSSGGSSTSTITRRGASSSASASTSSSASVTRRRSSSSENKGKQGSTRFRRNR